MATKQVLIITSRSEKTVAWKEREQYVKVFCEALEDYLGDVHARYTTYRDLRYSIRQGVPSIYDTSTGADLKDFDFVHFKNWQYELGEAPVVAAYLKMHGVLFFNSEVHVPISPGKLAQMFLLGANGVPVPDTFYARKEQLLGLFSQGMAPEGFDFPFIMKANDASRGDDNHLVDEAKQAVDILTASDPDKEYVVQRFIPNDGDYRFLFMGLDAEPLVFHRKAGKGTHLNNTSKGGSGRFMQSNQLPPQYTQYARRAAELTGREVGGVDILVDSQNGKPYVLEVNGTPALATGYGVDIKTKRFADFLRRSLEAQEEE